MSDDNRKGNDWILISRNKKNIDFLDSGYNSCIFEVDIDVLYIILPPKISTVGVERENRACNTSKDSEFNEEPIQSIADGKRQVVISTRDGLIYSANITCGVNSITWQLDTPALATAATSSGAVSVAATPAVPIVENNRKSNCDPRAHDSYN